MLLPADEVISAAGTRRSWLTLDRELIVYPQDRKCHMAGAFMLSMP